MEVGIPSNQSSCRADFLTGKAEVITLRTSKWKPLELPVGCDQESKWRTSHVPRKPEIRATLQGWMELGDGPHHIRL